MKAAVKPLVSVLIPAYNHERFVERCLDSVLEDPYPAKEIVIIDDGSTDRTGERIAEWAARYARQLRVEYVRHDENRGIAATLNELAARAHGEFLRLGASDDYLLPGGLAAQVNYLQQHPRKRAVVGDSIVVDQYGNKLHDSGMRDLHGADKRLYSSDEGIRRAVISQWAIGGPVALLRKSALETVDRWTEGLRIDDWDFFLRLAARDALGFIDMPVCAYRLHGNNVSKTRHTATRIVNLTESWHVARRRADLFDEPYRSLLKAQSHYISAKIAFLQKRSILLACHLLAYLSWLIASKVRLPPAGRLVEKT
ncbi:glycosyltransferase family 2 protein [Dyella nitratireducens]|uniref:Glycosyl transferase n=1 Tax=Dyella nitratireducens TaxID=1849580 RepID=A0ABQ1G8M5_9GAMM|nr:glycosyltransferase family 2 protein [Dyella nitratireducens]GGA38845.1 glycosyl transferase [Dyella nitratireducens]GLQ40370.1 glycosyl transferase [Dyella nitratireducens]